MPIANQYEVEYNSRCDVTLDFSHDLLQRVCATGSIRSVQFISCAVNEAVECCSGEQLIEWRAVMTIAMLVAWRGAFDRCACTATTSVRSACLIQS